MKSRLRQLGVVLVLFGMVSALGQFSDPAFVRILGWMNAWGEIAGWFIRVGFVAAGVALILTARPESEV